MPVYKKDVTVTKLPTKKENFHTLHIKIPTSRTKITTSNNIKQKLPTNHMPINNYENKTPYPCTLTQYRG